MVQRELCGNGTLTVKVENISGGRAGLEIRADNVSATTWIGDLGSSLAYANIAYNNHGGYISIPELQQAVDIGSPAKDMLGNIDAYVIAYSYLAPAAIGTSGSSGPKVSEILENYYLGIQNYYSINGLTLFQNRRYSIFAGRVGLLWQPSTQMFINSEFPYKEYSKQTGMSGALFVGAGVASSDLVRAAIFARKVRSSTFRYELVKLFFKSLRQAIIDQ